MTAEDPKRELADLDVTCVDVVACLRTEAVAAVEVVVPEAAAARRGARRRDFCFEPVVEASPFEVGRPFLGFFPIAASRDVVVSMALSERGGMSAVGERETLFVTLRGLDGAFENEHVGIFLLDLV